MGDVIRLPVIKYHGEEYRQMIIIRKFNEEANECRYKACVYVVVLLTAY